MKVLSKWMLIWFVPALLLSCSAGIEVSNTKEFKIDSDGIDFIEVYGGKGELDITGVPGGKEIIVKAEIVAVGEGEGGGETEGPMKNAVVELTRRGNRAVIRGQFKQGFFLRDLINPQSGHIHMDIMVPSAMELRIWDEEGDIYINTMEEDVLLDDGEGNIIIENTKGRIEIKDDEGDINGTGIEGEVTIDDGVGMISLSRVKGNIRIEDKGGDIETERIFGNVSLFDTDGGITLQEIEGDVNITAGGKGNVRLKNISGEIKQNF